MNENPCILVADNDSGRRGATDHILKQVGYQVIEASTGTECLRLARQKKPDLILLNTDLPDKPGQEVCRQLKAEMIPPGSFIILLAPHENTVDYQEEDLETGADDYIIRPISKRDLLARVRVMIRLKRSEEKLHRQMELRQDGIVHQNEELFRLVVTNSPNTVFYQDQNLVYTWVLNPTPPFTAEQVVGKKDEDLFPPAEVQRLTELKRRVLETRVGCHDELLLGGGETTRYFGFSYQPWEDQSGQVVGIAGYGQDITRRKQTEEQIHYLITEQKRVEAALQESIQTVQALLNSPTNAIIFLMDTAGTILAFNDAFTNYMGKPPADLLGRCVYDLLPSGVAQYRCLYVTGVIQSGQPVDWEEYDRGRWLYQTVYPIYDSAGAVTRIAVYALDITKRVELEQEIRQLNQDLERRVGERTAELAATNQILQAEIIERRQVEAALEERIRFEMLLTDLSATFINLPAAEIGGAIVQSLRRIVELLGFDRSTVAQFSEDGVHLRITHSYADPRFRPAAAITLNNLVPWFTDQMRRGELVIRNNLTDNIPEQAWQDRAYTQVEGLKAILGIPLLVDKKVLGAITFASLRSAENWSEDQVQRFRLIGEILAGVLARQRGEEALRASEERFRNIFEQAAVGLAHVGLDGRFLRVNQQFCTITGYTPADLLKFTFQQITYPPDLVADTVFGQQLLAGQLPAYEAEKRYVRPDGSLVWVQLNVSLVHRPDGVPDYFISAVKDISDRKQLEERLAAVYQLGQELTLLHNEEAIIQRMLTTATAIMGVVQAAYGRVDSVTQELEYGHILFGGELQISRQRLPLDGEKGFGVMVVRSGQALIAPETGLDQRYYPWLEGWSGRSAAVIPLKVGERVIGVLNVESAQPDYFTPADQQILQVLADQVAVAVENARLYDETKQWARRLALLHDLDRAINASLHLNDVYETFVDHAYHLLPADHISLVLRNGEQVRVIFIKNKFGETLLPGSTYPLTASTSIGWVIMNGQILLRRNLARENCYDDDKYLLAQGLQSGMVIPLQVKGRVIGTWNIGSRKADAYHPDDVIIAQSIADPLAIAIENAQLFEQIEQEVIERKRAEAEIQQLSAELEKRVEDRTRELAALYQVTALASEAMEPGSLLGHLLEQSLIAMRSRVGVIHTWDEIKQVLRLDVQRGLPSAIRGQLQNVRINDTLPGWVIQHGEPLLVADCTTDLRAPRITDWGQLQTYLGVPMRTGGQSLGVLSVFGQAGQQFSPEEVALLASIGDQVGVTIENTRLRQQAKQTAIIEERERLARDLHDAVTQSLYSLLLLAGGGQRLARKGQLENLDAYLGNLVQVAHQALKEMRLLIYQLRPSMLVEQGLAGALQQRLEAVENRANIQTRLNIEGLLEWPVPSEVELELYRIAQEALNNALKHAQATEVVISVQSSRRQIVLEVADNGKGFNPAAIQKTGGIGLVNMYERAAKMGGALTILSEEQSGTTIKVIVPLGESGQ